MKSSNYRIYGKEKLIHDDIMMDELVWEVPYIEYNEKGEKISEGSRDYTLPTMQAEGLQVYVVFVWEGLKLIESFRMIGRKEWISLHLNKLYPGKNIRISKI